MNSAKRILTACAALLTAVTLPSLMGAPETKSEKKKLPETRKVEKAPKPSRPAPSHRPASTATPRTEMRTWLGVATSPVAPVLREHLDLAEGFGIQIEYVVEDSPADKAGLKKRDLLTQLDDQLLTSPEHLAILVRSKKKGDKLTLTLIRKGAEESVNVTLGENEMPVQEQWPRSFGFHAQPSSKDPNTLEFHGQVPVPHWNIEEWTKHMRENPQSPWFHPRRPQPAKPAPAPPSPEAKPVLPLPKSDEKKSTSPPSEKTEKAPAISVRPGFPIEVFSGAGMVRIDNSEGEVTIQVKDGEHTIKIVNAKGETVYEGDYDPEKGADGLPAEAGKQLKKMKLDDLKLLGVPGPGSKTETKTEIKIQIGSDAPSPDGKGDLL